MAFWESLGSPQYILSPMVDQSDAAFRVLCRRYGMQLCYSQMLLAKSFVNDPTYRRTKFDPVDEHEVPIPSPINGVVTEDSTSFGAVTNEKIIAQFAGDCPSLMLKAATMVQSYVKAVDINCGCPQPAAKKSNYGASLLRQSEIICHIISQWKQHLTTPATCKIRLLDGHEDPNQRGLQGTLRLVDELVAAGVSAITVHARNRLMTGKKTGAADWNAIAIIKSRVGSTIPIIANGNIEHFSDVEKCLHTTKCDAVMSAEAALENPAFFSNRSISPFHLSREYLSILSSFPNKNFYDINKCVKTHVIRILHSSMKKIERLEGINFLDFFENLETIEDIEALVNDMEKLYFRNCFIVNAIGYRNIIPSNKLVDIISSEQASEIQMPEFETFSSKCANDSSEEGQSFEENYDEDSWYRRHRFTAAEGRAERKSLNRSWYAKGVRIVR